MVSEWKLGRGSKKNGGTPASVGHLYAGGNTEERYRVSILGARPKGRPGDKPWDHATGRGRIAKTYRSRAQYRDPLARRARVDAFVVETSRRRGRSRRARSNSRDA